MYEHVIIIGTGRLAFKCAKMVLALKKECRVLEFNSHNYSNLQYLCMKNKINYESVEKEYLTEVLFHIRVPALIVSANNTYIFPAKIVNKKNLMIINFHPALLPKHPGRNAEAWSIYEGDLFTGITWHKVTCEVDRGEIIWQEKIPIDAGTTSLKLMNEQFALAEKGFQKIIENVLNENIIFYPNQGLIKERIHYSKDIPNGGRLDENWAVQKMSQFLRAMDYGKLQVLGKAYLIRNKEIFVWDKYEIVKTTEESRKDTEKGIYISNGLKIRLINLRKG